MMNPNTDDFNRDVVAPVECLKESWALIKDQYWLFLGICVVGMMLGSAFALVLMGPMMCGIYLCLFQRMRGEQVSFDTVFKGFDYFAQSVIATLIQAIPAVVIVFLVYLIMGFGMFASMATASQRGGEGAAMAGFLVTMITVFLVIMSLSILLGVFFIFTFPLIVDRKLSGVDAIKMSVKAAMANFRGVLGLVLLNALLSICGALACYVGAFFIIPITVTAHAVAYRRVFPEMAPGIMSPPPPPASWA